LRQVETPPGPPPTGWPSASWLPPALEWWLNEPGSDWQLLPPFVLVRLMLCPVPTLVRRLLLFSGDLRVYWAQQRFLANRMDSYQWRTLLWFRLGVAAYLLLLRRAPDVPSRLAAACLITAALRALRWRHLTRSECAIGSERRTPPTRPPVCPGRLRGARTPSAKLDLRPGELVRVRSYPETEPTRSGQSEPRRSVPAAVSAASPPPVD
jgi:hypothetical protein